MKVTIERNRLVIEPESPLEIAFVEDTLELRRRGDKVKLVRHDTPTTKDVVPFRLIAAKGAV